MDFSRLEATAFPPGRMRNLKAAVIGAGALGNGVIQTLCMAGIGSLLVIDPDVIEPTNRTRSPFFLEESSTGANKAETVAQVAGKAFPDSQISAFPEEVADVPVAALQQAEVWFSCVHSLLARVEVASLAARLRRPVIDGGLGGQNTAHGRISWFPSGAACFSCLLPSSVRAQCLSACEETGTPCAGIEPDVSFPGAPSIAAVTAGLQIELGLRSFFERRADAISWRIWTSPSLRTEELTHSIAEQCPFHWPRAVRQIEIDTSQVNARDLLASVACADLRHPYVMLHWPLCVAATCGYCGSSAKPFRRKGNVLRRLACPQCGRAGGLREVECIRGITAGSPWARYPLAMLGVTGTVVLGHAGGAD